MPGADQYTHRDKSTDAVVAKVMVMPTLHSHKTERVPTKWALHSTWRGASSRPVHRQRDVIHRWNEDGGNSLNYSVARLREDTKCFKGQVIGIQKQLCKSKILPRGAIVVAARVDADGVGKAAPSPMQRSRSGQNGIVSAHLGQ